MPIVPANSFTSSPKGTYKIMGQPLTDALERTAALHELTTATYLHVGSVSARHTPTTTVKCFPFEARTHSGQKETCRFAQSD